MSAPEPPLVRWGPARADDPPLAAAWPGLAPDRRPGDWIALLEGLAGLAADGPVLVLGGGVAASPGAVARLAAAAAEPGGGGILGALDNLELDLSPLPPGRSLAAPLPVPAIAGVCAWLGHGLRVPVRQPPLGAALWWPGVAAGLLAAGWRAGQPLPDDLPCHALAGCFVADPARPLDGPRPWQRNAVPPPASGLDPLRGRWPVRDAADGDGEGEILVPDPAGPVPGPDGRPVVLHICHGWGGGSQRFIDDLAGADPGRCHILLSAHGDTPRRQYGEWLELRPVRSPGLLLERIPLLPAIAATATEHASYRQALRAVVARWQVRAVMVSSLIGHGLDALSTGLPTLVVGHDYYPLWPELHVDFGDPGRRFDLAELERDLAAAPLTLLPDLPARRWWQLREAYVERLLAVRPALAVPTAQVRANVLRMAAALAGLDWQVVPHGLADWPQPVPVAPTPPPPRRRLRVLVPGRIGGGKGMALLPELLDRLDGAVEFVLVGAGVAAGQLLGRPGVHILGNYRRDHLPGLVARLQPDLALLPASVAETFGYLLSELRSLAVPVLATALGSYAERIADGVDGLLAPPRAADLAARLRQLQADHGILADIRARLAATPGRDAAAMALDYHRLLPLAGPVAPADTVPDWRDAGAAWLERCRLELQQQRDHLRRNLREAELELARRADWGFGLERRVRALTGAGIDRLRERVAGLEAHIEALNAEAAGLLRDRATLQQRSDELERVHRSRSWRLMGPLRRLARLLRALRVRLGYRRRQLANLGSRARLSLATRGLAGSLRHWRQRRRAGWTLRTLPGRVVPEPVSTTPPAAVPAPATPLVSIVIPTYGKLAYTCACLASLVEHADAVEFEVIVVDDASPDDSAQVLAGVEGLRLLRNPANLGFVGSCNAGAAVARGRWLLFLNNDTEVGPGWLAALLDTFQAFPDAGLVGARLVYPDGRLQEAGGLVFSDGSGWNYGRFEDPDAPQFGYARATDYCSGAAIVIERRLFAELGGFDQRYAPAYYEDTDLAFKVRASGRSVVVQPAATVVHHEGVTAGTDLGAGMKRYQVVNQGHFQERWREALARQPAPGTDVEAIVRAAPRGRVLVIDATTPEPDQDSGSVRLTHLLHLLRQSGRHVTFFADNRAWVPDYSARLQRLGIEVLYDPWLGDPVTWLRAHGGDLDAVMVCRHYIAGNYLDLVRQYAPRARFVFDTVDLHYLREQRAAELTGSEEIARQAARTRGQELRLINAADVAVVVSSAEQALLARDAPGARVEVLSNVHPVLGCRRGHGERAGLFFVGGFQHPPNLDAVIWFAQEVFPTIRAALPGIEFHVVGSRMPPAILGLEGDGIRIHGHVADLEPFLDGCRIALAPLRYGAGVKGKVNMSMSYGQPVVATPMAVEGMHLTDGTEVLVADGAQAFAGAVLRLYEDAGLWQRLSDGGLDNVRRHFSLDAARTAIERIFSA
jgi:GT2 family glycosyltransferase/glycosyltransferase involved in cell wall biosynthesis